MSDLYFNEENDYSEKRTVWAWQKKTCGNLSYEKKTKQIDAVAADLLHIRTGCLDWCRCRHCKNRASKIDCLCCREEDAMLVLRLKSHSRREASRHAAVMSNCPTIRPTYYLYLPSTWVLFVHGVAEANKNAWWI